MANMNLPPVDIPPLSKTLTKWGIRSAILLVIVAVWVLAFDGPGWLWWAWVAFVAAWLVLVFVARWFLGSAMTRLGGPPGGNGGTGED